MNLAEAAANRELLARVASLEMQLQSLTKRVDDLSAAERRRTEKEGKTLGLKTANG